MAVYGTNIDINVIGNAITQLQAIQAEYMKLKHDQGKEIKVGVDDQASHKLSEIENKEKQIPTRHDTRLEVSGTQGILGSLNQIRQKASSTFASFRNDMHKTSESAHRLRDVIAGTAIGQGIFNGVSAALGTMKNGILGAVKAGFEYNAELDKMNATWTTLTGSAGKADKMTKSIINLSNTLGQSVDVTDELAQQFYHVFDNQPETEKLTKSFLTMGDAIGLSGDRLTQVGMDFTHMLSASTLHLGELNQITDAFPMFGEALLEYEQKVQHSSSLTMNELRKQISAGKISAKDAEAVMNELGNKYKKASDNLMGTLPGMLRQIKAEGKGLLGAMVDPLNKAVNPIMKQVSKWVGDDRTKKEFSKLGDAANTGVAAVMQAFANAFGNGSITKMLDNMVNGLTNTVKSLSEWIARNGTSIVEIFGSIGSIAKSVGTGFIDALSDFLHVIPGVHSQGMKGIASAFKEIAKHQTALQIIGRIWATYFVTSKIMGAARAMNELYKNMLAITTLSKVKSPTGSLLGDIGYLNGGRVRKVADPSATTRLARYGNVGKQGVQIAPYLDERGFKGAWKRFVSTLPGMGKAAGETAGAATSKGLIARMTGSLAGLQGLGKGIAGKLGAGITIGLSAIDLARGLTPSFKGDRWKTIGKGAGGLIGAGIGAFFGGPPGAAIGGTIGNVVGGWLGKAAHGGWKLMKDIFNGDFSWSGLKKGFKRAWSDLTNWAGDEWSKFKKWWNGDSESSSSKSSSAKKAPSQKEIKSLGGNYYSKTDIANIKQMNAAVKAYTQTLRQLKAVTKKNDPTKQLRNMSKEFKDINPRIKDSAKYWKALAKPLQTSSKALQLVDKSMKSFKGKTNPLDRLNRSVEKLTKTLRRYQFGKIIAQQMSIADKSMSGKHSFVNRFLSMTKSIEKELRSFGKTFDKDWKDSWKNIDHYPNQGMAKVGRVVERDLDKIANHEESFTSKFLSGWRSWIDDVVSSMKDGFDKLPGIAQRSMAEIVSRLNRGISGINSVISDFGGDKQLSTIHYARGTAFNGGHPGGLAMINDGTGYHKQELVWQPSQGWKTFSGTNRIVTLEPGSQVISAETSHRALSALNIPHYANGTLSDEQQDEIAEQFMDNPVQASKNLILKLTDWNSNVPIIPSLGKASAIGFSRGIANVLKDLLGIIKEPINGDWTPVIKSAFRVLHLHAEGWQISKLLRQIQTESGGNEGAIGGTDGLSDGHATGLLQFKPGTFAHWADPRYSNIMKGFDQLVAAVRCLNAGGEGGWGNIGNGHGWANGGHIMQAEYALIGEDGDEYVINPNKPNALRLANEAMRSILKRNPNLAFNRPKIVQSQYQPVNYQFGNQDGNGNVMVSLVKTVIDKLDNIDIHPRLFVDDVRRPLNNLNALDYSRAMH